MRWIERKMAVLNVANNAAYKIMFYLDNAAMITVHAPKYGLVSVSLIIVYIILKLIFFNLYIFYTIKGKTIRCNMG